MTEMRSLKAKHEPLAPDMEFGIDFLGKADALYKLLMPRLPTALGTKLRQVGVTNGFELFRKLIQKMDPPRADSAFHLANEIRGLGGVSVCKDFAQTVRFAKFLAGKMDDFTIETGESFPDSDAARVFSQAIDEDTMGRVDDHDDLTWRWIGHGQINNPATRITELAKSAVLCV